MMDNLPPGVSPGMIPGNGPDDAAEEHFWDEVMRRVLEAGVGSPDAEPWEDPVVQIVREVAYDMGFADGRAEQELDKMEAAEAAREGTN